MKFSSAATIIAALAGGALAMQSEGAMPQDMTKENGMPATDSKYDTKSMLGLMMKAGAGEPMQEHEKRQLDALTKLLGVINKRAEMTEEEKRQLPALGAITGLLGGLGQQQQPPAPDAGDDPAGGLPGDESAGGLPGGPAAPVGGAGGASGAPVGGSPVGGGGLGGLRKRQGNFGGSGAGGGVIGDDVLGGAGLLDGESGSGAGAGGGVIDSNPFGGAGLGGIPGGGDDSDDGFGFKAKRNSVPRPMSEMEMVRRQLDVVTGLLGGLLGGGGGGGAR